MKILLCAAGLLLASQNLFAQDVLINSSEQLASAFKSAVPGTKLVILPGIYHVDRLDTLAGGEAQNPIVVTASIPGTVTIYTVRIEAFSIRHPYWTVEGLTIKGLPDSEHAFHITGDADHVVIRKNTLVDFNAHIKVNGSQQAFPDNGLIEANDLINTQARQTHLTVAAIDIVGGKGWLLRDNYIADFAKGGGDKVSYGLYVKGNSTDSVIENNLVICARKLSGGVRVGLSLGGGGTGKAYCEKQDCTVESTNGILRNNIVLNCSDVGIYLNKARDSKILNNTLLMTTGIDVRYPESNAIVANNILTGSIRERDGGQAEIGENVRFGTTLGMWLPALSEKLQLRVSDYDSKFPNWVTQEDVAGTQAWINEVLSYAQKTSIGLGQNETLNCFPDMAIGSLEPNTTECGTFWQADESAEVSVDFWGNKRAANQAIMGAIDYHQSSCNIVDRIEHKSVTLDHCLD